MRLTHQWFLTQVQKHMNISDCTDKTPFPNEQLCSLIAQNFDEEELLQEIANLLFKHKNVRFVIESLKTENLLSDLKDLCKGCVSIEINGHKNICESVKEYIKGEDFDVIEEDVLNEMIRLDTVINIHFYPLTSVGFYSIHHYDINLAIKEAINIILNG